MAPKRVTRSAGRGATAADSRTSKSSGSSGDPEIHASAVTATMLEGPAKFSTAYGSPVAVQPRRSYLTGSTNLEGVLKGTINSVRKDNRSDTQTRAQRAGEAAEAARQKNLVERDRRRDEEDDVLRKRLEGSLRPPAHRTPSPAPPDADAAEDELAQDTPSHPPRRFLGKRAASVEPTASSPAANAIGRQSSEPPLGSTPTRSFYEESHLFGDATLATPRPPSSAAGSTKANPAAQSTAGKTTGRIAQIPEESDEEVPDVELPQLGRRSLRSRPVRPQTSTSSTGQQQRSSKPAEPIRSAWDTRQKPPQRQAEQARTTPKPPPMRAPPAAARNRTSKRWPKLLPTSWFRIPSTGWLRTLYTGWSGFLLWLYALAEPLGIFIGWIRIFLGWASASLFAVFLAWVALQGIIAAGNSIRGSDVGSSLHWYGSDWRSNIMQFIPSSVVEPLAALQDEEVGRLSKMWRTHAKDVAKLRESTKVHGAAVDKLKKLLPSIISMDLDKEGKPVISQEFWHALKGIITTDTNIFTLQKNKDGDAEISDTHWAAVKKRLEKGGWSLPSGSAGDKAMSKPEVETIVKNTAETIAKDTMAKQWETWVKGNSAKLREMLGDAMPAAGGKKGEKILSKPEVETIAKDTMSKQWDSWVKDNSAKLREVLGEVLPPRKVSAKSDAEIVKLVKDKLGSKDMKKMVVSRDEFIRHLQNEFAAQRTEVKAELAELETKLGRMVTEAAKKLPTVPPPKSGSGGDASALTKKEVEALVKKAVAKSIGDAQLEAMAKGKIAANYAADLETRVNFFSRGAGAVVNPKRSSPSYAAPRSRLVDSNEWLRARPATAPHCAALESWEDQGDCWCAATRDDKGSGDKNRRRRPADLAVKMAHLVIPRHVVVEHIHAGATLDPGAMPADMEVWAEFQEYGLRRAMENWSAATFPPLGTPADDERHSLAPWNFMRIARFRYQPGAQRAGVQVEMLSQELVDLAAATDQIVVRALNNHGDVDHTCFYRVRLYGDIAEEVV